MAFAAIMVACCNVSNNDYTQFVDPFIGTGGHGHTFPGPVMPHGMIQPSPDTRIDGWDACSGYHYTDSLINGFTQNHLSGTDCADYGDFLRTGANAVAEDDPAIERVAFRRDIFEAFTRGYLESATFLTPAERDNLPYAVALFPYMQCVRFLTDYINGDTYYKIKYPEHNLVRTRNQLQLFREVYAQQQYMRDFINQCK